MKFKPIDQLSPAVARAYPRPVERTSSDDSEGGSLCRWSVAVPTAR